MKQNFFYQNKMLQTNGPIYPASGMNLAPIQSVW